MKIPPALNVSGLNPAVADRIAQIAGDLLQKHESNIHSLHIVGSAVIPDYDEKLSDVNSVVVLHTMDLDFFAFLAPLGKTYGRMRIAAPLVMTRDHIAASLDSFPLEFHDFKLIHRTVYGEDVFAGLVIDRSFLRLQCEREIKVKLIGLRQGYLSSLGKKDLLAGTLIRSVAGSMALFRAVISLLGKEPPIPRADVITAFAASTGIDTRIFETLLHLKAGRIKPSEQDLTDIFKDYYRSLESAGTIVNGIKP